MEDYYRSLKSYEDEGSIVDGSFGLDRALHFSTRFVAPDKLIYKVGPEGKPTTHLINGDDFGIIPGGSKRSESDHLFANLSRGSEAGEKSQPNSLISQQATLVLASAATLSGGLGSIILNLLIRDSGMPLWTRHDDFRKVGFKKIDGKECYLLRRVNEPLLVWIGTSDFSIRKIQIGANVLDQASQKVLTAVTGVGALFSSRAEKLMDKYENANLERNCTFSKIKFNQLEEADMDFKSYD